MKFILKEIARSGTELLRSFMTKCRNMHLFLNQNQKKNSGFKYLVITALVLVVLIATYFFTILGLVVAFGIGKYCSNNYYGNNKAEKEEWNQQ